MNLTEFNLMRVMDTNFQSKTYGGWLMPREALELDLNRGQHASTSYTLTLENNDLGINHITFEHDHISILKEIKAIEKEIEI